MKKEKIRDKKMNWWPFIIYCIFAFLCLIVMFKAGKTSIDLTNMDVQMTAADRTKYAGLFNKGKTSMLIWALFWLIFWGVVIYYLTVTAQIKYAWLIILIPIAQLITLFLSGLVVGVSGLWIFLFAILLIAIYVFTIYKTVGVIKQYGEN